MVETEWGRWDSRMSALEAMMWKTEVDPRLRSSGAGIVVFDRAPDWDRLVNRFDKISRLFPRLRQCVVVPPLTVDMPHWAVDPDFDLELHLRRVRLPDPGSFDQVLDLVEFEVASAYDPGRSPWSMLVIEGLTDGRAVMIQRMHHAVTDGMGAMYLTRFMYDDVPDPDDDDTMPPPPDPERVTPAGLLREALAPQAMLARGGLRIGQVVRSAGRAIFDARGAIARAASLGRGVLALAAGPPAPPSPALAGRSSSPRLDVFDVPLQEFKQAAKSVGGSLNDAFFAAIGGGLRRYHQRLGQPVRTVALGFPINVRSDDDPVAGNRFSGATMALPIDVADPADRIAAIRALVLAARRDARVNLADALMPVMYHLPTWALGPLSHAMMGIDVQASNIAGSAGRQYLGGAEIIRQYPIGPHPGTAMMIALLSYVDICCIGVNVDAAAVSDFPLFMDCLRQGFDEVLELAGSPSKRAARATVA